MVRATSPISKVPLLRIVLPLIAGVVFSVYIPHLWLLVLLVPPLIITLISLYVYRRESVVAYLSSLVTILLSMLLALFLVWERGCDEPKLGDDIIYFKATLLDTPQPKDRSLSLELRVEAVGDSLLSFTPADYRSILYVPYSCSSDSLKIGDKILYCSRFEMPDRDPLPGAFDYPAYLRRGGVYQSTYVDSTMWRVVGSSSSPMLLPAKWRAKLLDGVKGLLPEAQHHSIVEAIMLGYKQDLTQDQKRNFRVGGLSHLLAVSGFHVAILFSLFSLVLITIGRDSKFYILRVALPLTLLWCYALVVGATPSVLRASLMLTLYSLSKLLRRGATPYNTLLFAALILILIDPYSIWDIGAQLSFVAVMGIILYSQTLGKRISKLGRFLPVLLTLPLVTISAQIATAPLTIYYFNSFPTLFLLANILIVPLIYIIIFFTLPLLLIHMLLGVKFNFFVVPLEWVLDLLNSTTSWIASRDVASIDELFIPIYWVVILYLIYLILSLPIPIVRKTLASSALLLTLFASTIYSHWMESRRSGVELMYCSSGRVYVEYQGLRTIVYADSIHQRDMETLQRWSGRRRGQLVVEKMNEPLWSSDGRSILYLDSDTLRYKSVDSDFTVDYLVLERGCRGDLDHYIGLLSPKRLLLSPKLYGYWSDRWKHEADSLQIPIDIVEKDMPYRLY